MDHNSKYVRLFIFNSFFAIDYDLAGNYCRPHFVLGATIQFRPRLTLATQYSQTWFGDGIKKADRCLRTISK